MDLDFQTIFNESDNHSRSLYFHGCCFGYTNEEGLRGVINLLVDGERLYGTFYYKTNYGDLAIRRNEIVPDMRTGYLETIPLMTGIHYENEYGNVGFITLRPERRASKGLQFNRLTNREVFRDDNELFLFLIDVLAGLYSYDKWYTDREGNTFCCGIFFNHPDDPTEDKLQRVIQQEYFENN